MEKAISDLKECLKNDKVILFTGAGFSLGATNGLKQPLPTGNALKRSLLTEILGLPEDSQDYKSLFAENLDNIVEYCQDEKGQQIVDDYLRAKFENCIPADFHKRILKYKWAKIYTTNIDDVVENALSPDKYFVQNQLNERRFPDKQDKLEYIKLHGCVRNPGIGFVFGRMQYVKRIAENNNALVSLYNNDIQTSNFVFIGFNDDEIDLDTFLMSRESRATRKGKLFFINPNQSPLFRNKLKKKGAIHIPILTKDFANIIDSVAGGKKRCENEITGFLNVNRKLKNSSRSRHYNSRLYFGEAPVWSDICFDWDFTHPIVNIITADVECLANTGKIEHTLMAIHGPYLSGKTTALLRIGSRLCEMGYEVYEFGGREFNTQLFINACSEMSAINKFALLVDNAPYYYRELEVLANSFPKDKELLIIGTGTTRTHTKKNYGVKLLSGYNEYEMSRYMVGDAQRNFYNDVASHLADKKMLGNLISKPENERAREIAKHPDICSFLYDLTCSTEFKARFLEFYNEDKKTEGFNLSRDVLTILAIFQQLDVPGLPLETLVSWKNENYKKVKAFISDYVRRYDNDTISLRNTFLTSEILRLTIEKEKEDVIVTVLQIISSLVKASRHTHWNIIQERLIKVRDLRKLMKFSDATINRILENIKDYYDDDSNYWIQVGIFKQEQKDYPQAHVHLQAAVGLEYRSYLAQHALARNYLLWANSMPTRKNATPYFNEGKERMLKLIRTRDDAQIKAYSTNCYVAQSIRFWRKFEITPTTKEIKEMYGYLKDLYKRDNDDRKTREAIGVFYSFLKERGLKGKLPNLSREEFATYQSSYNHVEEHLIDVLSEDIF